MYVSVMVMMTMMNVHRRNKPVVVTGWLDKWSVREKWTLPYLKERLSDIEVEVRHKTNTAAYRQGSTYYTKKMKASPPSPFLMMMTIHG